MVGGLIKTCLRFVVRKNTKSYSENNEFLKAYERMENVVSPIKNGYDGFVYVGASLSL